jgi:hypothetical protein
MPTVSQILAASYPAVVAAKKKPANQWAESALMRELEKQNGIKRISFGPTLEEPLDYRRSPNSGFLATDLQTTSLTKTEVLTTAVYTPGQLSVEMVWSKADEAKNPTENQKVALVKSIIENGLETHDDLIEEALFATSTDGFLGLLSIYPDNGQGNVGGIDAAIDAWFRHYTATYSAAGTNINAQLTKAFNEAAKGTGGSMPSLIVSDGDTQAIFEGAVQTLTRYVDEKNANVGYKTLAFKDARWVFSPYGGTRIYGWNTKHTNLKVSKEFFREKGETQEIQNAHGYVSKMYSMLQLTTNNKSRGFVLTQVP